MKLDKISSVYKFTHKSMSHEGSKVTCMPYTINDFCIDYRGKIPCISDFESIYYTSLESCARTKWSISNHGKSYNMSNSFSLKPNRMVH